LWKHGNLWPAIASLSPTMSGYPRPAAGAYYTLAPQQTYGLPAQQPSPSDLRPPPPQGPSSQSPNFTLPPGVPLHANPRDLIVELCRIIERQSQEIVAMRQGRSQERGASAPVINASEDSRRAGAFDPAGPAAYSSLASPKDDESPPAPVVYMEEESSETAHSSAEDELADDLEEAPESHAYSCGLAALTAAANDSLSGDDEGSGPEEINGVKRKTKRQGGSLSAADMEDSGNRQCVACGTTQTPKWRCGMTLCNACGLRNAKRRCSGAVRHKPQQQQPLPLQVQVQAPPQASAYPQLAVPVPAPPVMAHPQAPPHNPVQQQAGLPPQPYGHFFYSHASVGFPTSTYPGMLLPPKAPPQPFSKPMGAADYPPVPMATPGLALLSDGMGSPQHHVTLAA